MKCQAIIEDYDRAERYNLRSRIIIPGEKPCSFKATFKIGKLHLCSRHTQLAVEGLIDKHGNVADRGVKPRPIK